ncbi:ABC transporter ATP-binding protein [Listeria floridensis FSL S10-1187]|uniref:ABC transporter ATP-binding protein n=1 Tax=Listeria floridensis FSL S10-1187 TaxID=1265817 RepID=A0ABP3AXI2_9LIST|nr:ABC transporter ATP-binding protein [Listeria floridensis FSL S10-1187]
MEDVEKPFEFKAVKIALPEMSRLKPGTTVLQVGASEIGFANKILFRTEPFSIKIGDKAALVGKNASGKTTFLRRLLKQEEPFKLLPGAKIAYFDQELRGLSLEETMLRNVERVNAHDKKNGDGCTGEFAF